MKVKILIAVIVVLAVATGGLYWFNHQSKDVVSTQLVANTATASSSATPPATTSKNVIAHWGAMIRPYGLKIGPVPYSKTSVQSQIDLLKELGATDARANVENEQTTNDEVVNYSQSNHLLLTLILEPTAQISAYADYYAYAKNIASRYKGKVAYYQLGNEASGVAIKQGFPGSKTTDYDDQKYAGLKVMLKGLYDGVHDADPSAKTIVSANWLGTGIYDRLAADKINYDIIGWDWYSDMGTDLIVSQNGTTINIPEYLKKYNKPFWVVELNRRQGTIDNNFNAQSDFIKTFVNNVASHGNVQGVFIYPLTDQCGKDKEEFGRMGLVTISQNGDQTCSIKDKKPSFKVFQDLIKQYGS